MNELVKKNLENVKLIAYNKVGKYIKKTRITKNGIFIYGHKVYSPLLMEKYQIYTFISWYDSNDYSYIDEALEYFKLDCERLKDCEA